MPAITTIGLDIAKSVFQVHGVDAQGNAQHEGFYRRGILVCEAFGLERRFKPICERKAVSCS
jgi:transposase